MTTVKELPFSVVDGNFLVLTNYSVHPNMARKHTHLRTLEG